MEQKSWIAVGVVSAVVIIGAAIVSSTGTDDPVLTQPTDNTNGLLTEEQPLVTSTPEQPVVAATTTPPVAATSTPVVVTSTPSKPTTSAPAIAVYTLVQVSAHASASDCWTVVRGNVYNVTPFVSRHPGGVEAISQVCGRDGTAFFEGQHGGQKAPESMLASLKVGVLAP